MRDYLPATLINSTEIVRGLNTSSSLDTQVAIVFAVIFGVFIYRIAISGLLYHLLSGINNRPTIIDFVVSITGAALQLLFIEVLNKIYEYLARLLNDWGK